MSERLFGRLDEWFVLRRVIECAAGGGEIGDGGGGGGFERMFLRIEWKVEARLVGVCLRFVVSNGEVICMVEFIFYKR